MSDTDPRLDVVKSWLPSMPTASRPAFLRHLDTADRAAGIVRVDTNDEAMLELIALAIWEEQRYTDDTAGSYIVIDRETCAETAAYVLAALREAAR